MKRHPILTGVVYRLMGGILLLFLSCSTENNAFDMQPGDIPITFSGTISGQLLTKVTATSFETNDRIGLFATLTPNSLDGKRYIDNLQLTCNSNGSSFTPARTVFYPEGGGTLDFVGYHPYQKEGLQAGSTTLSVSIQSDQSTAENFSASDFLTAKNKTWEAAKTT